MIYESSTNKAIIVSVWCPDHETNNCWVKGIPAYINRHRNCTALYNTLYHNSTQSIRITPLPSYQEVWHLPVIALNGQLNAFQALLKITSLLQLSHGVKNSIDWNQLIGMLEIYTAVARVHVAPHNPHNFNIIVIGSVIFQISNNTAAECAV